MLLPFLIAASLSLSTAIVIGMIRHNRRAQASNAWPRVPGKLLACELLSRPADEGPGDVYDLRVRYAYEVGGAAYESETIEFYFGQWGSERIYYEDLQRHLTATESLAVYVDPSDPCQAVLFPGSIQISRGMLVALSVFIFVGPLCGITAIYVLVRYW